MPAIVQAPRPKKGPSLLDMAYGLLHKQQKAEARAAKKAPPAEESPPPAKKRPAKKKPADKSALAILKDHVIPEHGTYMAVVRRLACRRCGKPAGPKRGNDFCHRNMGKAKSMKTDCREGWSGCPRCHKEIDEGGLPREERRRLELEYGASTRAEVIGKGLWPKNLPRWEDERK